ncbi:MAG: methyltransferase domain-containing protein [Kofleriaceae bacterium]
MTDHVELYGASYGNFATQLYADIRRDAFGEDIGQTSWIGAAEQDRFIEWLELRAGTRLLDVACGSGGPTLRIARTTGATVTGIDLHEQGIAKARDQAGEGARFEVADAAAPLAFGDASFDAVICIDAINHLANRGAVFAEWRRVLAPGGRLVFTDPIVVTGLLTGDEMRIRSSIGYFVFAPAGIDETLLVAAGFTIERVEDRTENMARLARGWFEARRVREPDLRSIEGADTFAGQQRFLETAAILAEQRRLSRFAFLVR